MQEQKELIASLGKIGANGNLEITMPDGSIKKIGEGFSELVGSDYGELQKMLDVNNMSELDVAKTSMGYLDEIKNLFTVGRRGLFLHCNIDHCISQSLELADLILSNKWQDKNLWRQKVSNFLKFSARD